MKQYDPRALEPKWQQIWEETKLYAALDFDPRPKQYVLAEFPYPSGEGLHVGHVRRYAASDIIARWYRMTGYNVLHPIGWDAFGLPTENFAIKNKTAPQIVTKNNVATFQRQLRAMGLSFDWDREVNTTDPSYYKWTQWIFLQLFKHGLAYQKEMPVNWCPKCKVGLADEEVVGGLHERCGTPVEKKLLKQWMLKITEYADRLIEDLKLVDYPEKVATQQINWIGRRTGVHINFSVVNSKKKIVVFTTRPDTLFGATYIVLAPEHPLISDITSNDKQATVDEYVKQTQNKSDLERQEDQKSKTGVFTGSYTVNPVNNEKIPIWIADYVLMSYGTGAIMAVPAHDQRDFEFATKFKLPIKTVIEPVTGEKQQDPVFRKSIVAIVEDPKTHKLLSINWNDKGGNLFIGGGLEESEDALACAQREITEETGYQHVELISQSETIHHHYFAHIKQIPREIEAIGFYFKLTDKKQIPPQLEEYEQGKFTVEWITAEQAEKSVTDPLHRYLFEKFILKRPYTGEGIMTNSGVYDGLESKEARAVIFKDLEKSGIAETKVNYKLRDWIFSRQHYWGDPIPLIHCAKCGIVPVPDDQLPLTLPAVEHYEPTDSGESPLAKIEEWVNVECPSCGEKAKRETDTMPNWAGSSWYYLRYIDPHNDKAFADPEKLRYWLMVDTYIGGMEHTTLHLLYSRFWHKFLYDQGLVPTSEPYDKRRPQGMILATDGKKMSKSLGNVVNPDEIIKSGYGADSLRMYEMFLGPMHQDTPWEPSGVTGTYRYLNRTWVLVQSYLTAHDLPLVESDNQKELETQLVIAVNKAIQKVTKDLESLSFNTAIAALMEVTNALYKLREELPFAASPEQWRAALESLLLLLAPFAPHITEELWQDLDHEESIHVQGWPQWNPELLQEDLVTIVVQVNGKVRASLAMASGASENIMKETALANEKVKQHLKDKKIIKIITVPNKVVNFVVK